MTVTDVGAPPVPTVPGDPITDQVMLWFCPGGDIADLHRGRDACTALAQAAATARPALRSTHDRARERWTGNAAEQFSTDIAQVDAWLGRCEAACDNAAQTLDRQATIKEQQLHEAHMHMIHGAVDVLAAAGTGGGWLVRRAAAAATEQAAASLVEVMAPVTKEAADLLTAQAVAAADAAEAAAMQGAPALSRAMHYMGNQMPEWAQSILSGHAISAFGRLVDKVLGGASSPIAAFSMESWGGIDLANVEAGGFLTPVFTGIPKALGIDGWLAGGRRPAGLRRGLQRRTHRLRFLRHQRPAARRQGCLVGNSPVDVEWRRRRHGGRRPAGAQCGEGGAGGSRRPAPRGSGALGWAELRGVGPYGRDPAGGLLHRQGNAIAEQS